MDYSKYFCPVCKKNFNDNDDIVVCPECGTPHHRECWNSLGCCANKDKHNTNEKIKETYCANCETIEKSEEPKEEKNVVNFKDENKSPEEILEKLKNQGFNDPSTTYLIDGDEAYLYEIAVGKNQKYYLPRFMIMSQINKGVSFNFTAFFWPLAWSLYRKMYKAAAIIFAIYFAILGCLGFFFVSNKPLIEAAKVCVEEDPNFYQNIVNFLNDRGNTTLTVKQQKFIEEYQKVNIPFFVTIITTVLFMGIRISMGLFGNKKYLEKLKRNIRNAKMKNMTEDELKAFLYKKYGTLPIILAVIIGFFEFSFI